MEEIFVDWPIASFVTLDAPYFLRGKVRAWVSRRPEEPWRSHSLSVNLFPTLLESRSSV